MVGCAGQSYDRFTIAPRPNDACRAGAMEPLLLAREEQVSGAALASTPGPHAGHAGLEIDGLVVRVNKVTIDLRSRHSTKRMHAVQGLWNPFY
jgi:hypothetical protein